MPKTAYADQNFLVYLASNVTWREAVLHARQTGKLIPVLSPWHFYEYGNGRSHADAEKLIVLAEELNPMWAMTRADTQLFEFWAMWEQIWTGSQEPINPIGSLQDTVAVLSRVHSDLTSNATIRAYVEAFSQDDALNRAWASMEYQQRIAKDNLKSYVEGRFNKATLRRIELSHIGLMRSQIDLKTNDYRRVDAYERTLWTKQPLAAQLGFFVDMGCMRYLKSYKTECAFSEDLYATGGQLDRNRFVDREHASVALPYCNYFVTSDKQLTNSCNRVRKTLPFEAAEIVTADSFIQRLTSDTL